MTAPDVRKTLLLARPRGFCAGVDRAISIVDQMLAKVEGPLYVRKEIVHNRAVVDDFRNRGVVFVDELDEVPAGADVVFSAHGVSPEVRDDAARRGLRVVDATCPLVTKVHKQVVSNAGRELFGPFTASRPPDWHSVFELNVFATMRLAQAFAKKARDDRDGGVAVTISSAAALVGARGAAVYAASKAALLGWTRSVALEWAPLGIRVNAICLGWTKTSMYERFATRLPQQGLDALIAAHPLGLGDPEAVSTSIAQLMTPAFSWMTGSVVVLDGGYTAG